MTEPSMAHSRHSNKCQFFPRASVGQYFKNSVDFFVVVVQSLSCLQLFVMPWTAACRASLSFTISRSLCKLMSIELMMPSNHLILCHPLIPLPSIFPSGFLAFYICITRIHNTTLYLLYIWSLHIPGSFI